MVEPVTIGLAAGYLAKDGFGRLLGPALDEVGKAIARYTEHRLRNVGRIARNANQKVANTAEPGAIPMRVAMRVFEEGSFSDDELVVEYLGGVLASSYTPHGRDDRGNTFTALVSRLSTYDLRTHCIVYSEVIRLLRSSDLNIQKGVDVIQQATIFVPFEAYNAAMKFGDNEDPNNIFSSVIYNLDREKLIAPMAWGDIEHLAKHFRDVPAQGFVFNPTPFGMTLFLWALGLGHLHANDAFSKDFKMPTISDLETNTEAVITSRVNQFPRPLPRKTERIEPA